MTIQKRHYWESLKINHLGDWEFVGIRLEKDYPYNPKQVYYSAHYPVNWTEEQIRRWGKVEKYNETHLVVYVPKPKNSKMSC
ncbi:MAG: hypothetical protein ABIJ11_06025 [Elusimicrobiota bacterium]